MIMNLNLRLDVVLYVGLLVGAVALLAFVVFTDAFGSVAIIPPGVRTDLLEDESIFFMNITYWNGPTALVTNTIMNFELSDEIVRFVNDKIREEQGLDPLLEEELPEEEIKEIEESSDDSDNGGNGNDDGNGGDDNGDDELPIGPPIEDPILPPGEEGEEFALLTDDPCSQVYLAVVIPGYGPPEYCYDKIREAAEQDDIG